MLVPSSKQRLVSLGTRTTRDIHGRRCTSTPTLTPRFPSSSAPSDRGFRRTTRSRQHLASLPAPGTQSGATTACWPYVGNSPSPGSTSATKRTLRCRMTDRYSPLRWFTPWPPSSTLYLIIKRTCTLSLCILYCVFSHFRIFCIFALSSSYCIFKRTFYKSFLRLWRATPQ
jgi:hypothetical protein